MVTQDRGFRAGSRLPVYCLNLERSVDRRRHMESEFARLGWNATFLDALDGPRSLNRQKLYEEGSLSRRSRSLCGPLSLSEIGCFMSHARVWKRILEQQHAAAMICEDDVRFDPCMPDPEVLYRNMPSKFDLLYWSYLNNTTNSLVAAAFDVERDQPVLQCGGHRVFRAWGCGGSACYLITARAARRLLRGARPMLFPVDGYMARMAAWRRVQHYALHPRPAVWCGLPPTITRDDS